MNISELLKGASGLMGNESAKGDLGSLAGSVLSMISKDSGGITGLVEKFQSNGLGDIAKSWVSRGQNLPVSADQLTQVFGEQKLGAMAEESGMNLQQFLPILMAGLPLIIDKLTPDGEVNDESSNLVEQGMGLLGSFLKK